MLKVKNIKGNSRRRSQAPKIYKAPNCTVFQVHLRNTLETTQTLNIRGNLLSMLRKHRFSAGNYFASFLKLNFSREFHLTNCIKCGKCSAMEISLSRIMFRKNESQKLHEENFAQNFTRMVWNAGKSHCSLSVLF